MLKGAYGITCAGMKCSRKDYWVKRMLGLFLMLTQGNAVEFVL